MEGVSPAACSLCLPLCLCLCPVTVCLAIVAAIGQPLSSLLLQVRGYPACLCQCQLGRGTDIASVGAADVSPASAAIEAATGGLLLHTVLLRLARSGGVSLEIQERALHTFVDFCHQPDLMPELYLNYDCDVSH